MADDTLFAEVLDRANRPDPYPIYARLRETPVSRQRDGSYVVSTHAAIRALLFDPRLSSEDLPPAHRPRTGNPFKDLILNPIRNRISTAHRPLIFRDPPDHDRLRGLVMREFSIPRVLGLRERVAREVDGLIDACRGRSEICLVGDLSYPLPVSVICTLLGVPEADEPRFQGWATQLSTALEPDARYDQATRRKLVVALDEISVYLRKLIREKRRHPEELKRLRADPERAPRVIEEMLRYEPPVHFRTHKALGAIEVGGQTIPKGAPVVLLLAAASRDPARFADPDRFAPDREDTQHLGFGGGLHYCIGAPLARIEAEIALVALSQRLVAPRLLKDPPPYRPGAALRGPEQLEIGITAIT